MYQEIDGSPDVNYDKGYLLALDHCFKKFLFVYYMHCIYLNHNVDNTCISVDFYLFLCLKMKTVYTIIYSVKYFVHRPQLDQLQIAKRKSIIW